MKFLIVLVQASCPALLSPRPYTKLKTFEKNKNADSILYQTQELSARITPAEGEYLVEVPCEANAKKAFACEGERGRRDESK